jgi:hypothetical protein
MTEEGIARSKNFGRRIRRYVLVIVFVVVAVIGGYGVNRYYTRSHLNVLQRMYLPQYELTILQSCLPAKWDYYTLVAAPNDVTVLDEETPYTSDENIEPVLDEEGQTKLYKSGLPILRLKRITDDKVPAWVVRSCSAEERYAWLHSEIYKGRTMLDIWKPAIGIGVVIFLFGVALCVLTDSLINRISRRGKRNLLADSFDLSKKDRFQEQISAGKDQCVQ